MINGFFGLGAIFRNRKINKINVINFINSKRRNDCMDYLYRKVFRGSIVYRINVNVYYLLVRFVRMNCVCMSESLNGFVFNFVKKLSSLIVKGNMSLDFLG